MEVVMMRRDDFDACIRDAARMAAEEAIRNAPKSRPEQYTIADAAAELGRNRNTVGKMVRDGEIKLNRAGKIPRSEIERLIRID